MCATILESMYPESIIQSNSNSNDSKSNSTSTVQSNISNRIIKKRTISGVVAPVDCELKDDTINSYLNEFLPNELHHCIKVKSMFNSSDGQQARARSFIISNVEIIKYLPSIPSFGTNKNIYWNVNQYTSSHNFCRTCGERGHWSRTCPNKNGPIKACIHCRESKPKHTANECSKKKTSATKPISILLCAHGQLSNEGTKYVSSYFHQSINEILMSTQSINSNPTIQSNVSSHSYSNIVSGAISSNTINQMNIPSNVIESIISTVTSQVERNFMKMFSEQQEKYTKQIEHLTLLIEKLILNPTTVIDTKHSSKPKAKPTPLTFLKPTSVQTQINSVLTKQSSSNPTIETPIVSPTTSKSIQSAQLAIQRASTFDLNEFTTVNSKTKRHASRSPIQKDHSNIPFVMKPSFFSCLDNLYKNVPGHD